MAIDKYYLKARLFPTVLTAIPVIIIFNKFISSLYHDRLENIFSGLPTITDIILSSSIVFLFVQVNRFLSKEIFQKLYFQDEVNMPTTNVLLKSNKEFDPRIKQQIEDKIKTKFGINLLSAKDELLDEARARKLIITAVSQIRNNLRNNTLLLQHNIEYGFFRNFIGGSFLALLISIALLVHSYYFNDAQSISFSWILSIIYSIPIIFSRLILDRYGKYYSKILYEQFLTIG